MNKELKEQAHKEFDEKASKGASKGGFLADYYDDYDAVDFDTDLILNFIDSLIDKTVQMTEERIVGVIEESKDGSDGDVALDYVIKLIKRK